MKMIRMIAIALFAMCALAMNAQKGSVVTINGNRLESQVVKITFTGEQAVLHFADGNQMVADMAELVIDFTASQETAIQVLKTPVDNQLLIEGLAVGTPVTIYDAQGKVVLRTQTSATSLPVQSLRSGVYLLKANNQIVKFVKR